MRQVPDEYGEVSADAGAEGKEEDDEDDDGDVEEGAARGRQVGLEEFFKIARFCNCAVAQDVDGAAGHAGHQGREEEVVGGHRGRASNQDCAGGDQEDLLTHQSGEDKLEEIENVSSTPNFAFD